MDDQGPNIKHKDLNNGLFSIIKNNFTSKEKIIKIKKYLNNGADINAVDVNDMNNTLLHVAVMKAEVPVIKFLLYRGADTSIKNNNNQTALDIVPQCDSDLAKKVSDVLTKSRVHFQKPVSDNTYHKKAKAATAVAKESTINNDELDYSKRQGTSGISGHLYETKLLTLILARMLAMCDKEISEFYLGTNIEGMGAFDDIVLKYTDRRSQKTKLLFLQAKHKDEPKKYNITLEELLKQDDGDFCLFKYFQSYLEIKRKFKYNSRDILFKGAFKNIDCDFIIYTPAIGKSDENIKEAPNRNRLIETSKNGNVFQIQLNSEDVKKLIPKIVESRTELLAKRLSKFVLSKKYVGMMTDEMIKTYHVFLANHVILVQNETNDSVLGDSYIVGKFRESFLSSTDKLLIIMKQTICKELKQLKNHILTDETAIEDYLEKLTFKLPPRFGNVTFTLQTVEQEQNVCFLFRELLKRANKVDSLYVVKIDESMIGYKNIIKDSDFKSRSLGGLVGNLIIYDDVTKTLKFNVEANNLPVDCKKIMEKLKQEHPNLNKYRIDDLTGYLPEMSLEHEECDAYRLKEFLTKLKLYTNQVTEDEVEKHVKDAIKVHCNLEQNYSILRVSCDALFLNFHDKIQKWWQLPKKAKYLSKSCKYLEDAKHETLGSPFLNILDYRCKKIITNDAIRFNQNAIKGLNIDKLLSNDRKILGFFSDEITFTSIKILQHLDQVKGTSSVFIDMDYAMNEEYLEPIKNELKSSNVNMLVLVYSNNNTSNFDKDFEVISNEFNGNIIIITDSKEILTKLEIKKIDTVSDKMNTFTDLTCKVQKIIREERELIFQGRKIHFNEVVNNDFLKSLKPHIIRQIGNSQSTIIGQKIADKAYTKTVDFYTKRSISRHVTLSVANKNCADLDFVKDINIEIDKLKESSDIILLAKSKNDFDVFCNKIKDRNVHWFSQESNDHYVWIETRGSINTILKYAGKNESTKHRYQPETLKDIEDKIVIISAEPGMGKSTFLSHLAERTKSLHKNMWVLTINFHDHINQLTKWKDEKTNINLIEAFKLLYAAADIPAFGKDNGEAKLINLNRFAKQIVVNDANEVHMNDMQDDILEVHLFNYCYNNGNVALLFDGFDEICPDFDHEAIELLQTLKSSKVAHLWVTTRPYNVVGRLQSALGIFSYTLQPLTESEQQQCLHDIWSSLSGLGALANDIESLFYLVTDALNDDDCSFTSIPLHIYMIVEVYTTVINDLIAKDSSISNDIKSNIVTDKIKSALGPILNPCSLYDKFVYTKFYKIRFGNKLNSKSFKEPEMRMLLSEKYEKFIDRHKKTSAYTLFHRTDGFDLLSKDDIKDIHSFIKIINSEEEKTGIIERVVGNEPIFVHLTFAEYFATEFLFDRLQSNSCDASIWKLLINSILVSDNGGIRWFFNSKLQDQQFPFNVDKLISNIILEAILSQSFILKNAFAVSVQDDLDSIAYFLITCFDKSLNANNLDDFIKLLIKSCDECICTWSLIVKRSKNDILKYIFSIIKRFDKNKIIDLFYCNDNCDSFQWALLGYMYSINCDTINIIMEHIDDEWLADLLTFQPDGANFCSAHLFGTNPKTLALLKNDLLKLSKKELIKIFNVVDRNGRLPAHHAALVHNYDFFTFIESYLGKEELKLMCLKEDNNNDTPIVDLSYCERCFSKFVLLLNNIFDWTNLEDLENIISILNRRKNLSNSNEHVETESTTDK